MSTKLDRFEEERRAIVLTDAARHMLMQCRMRIASAATDADAASTLLCQALTVPGAHYRYCVSCFHSMPEEGRVRVVLRGLMRYVSICDECTAGGVELVRQEER